jgi:hypothetical protein
LWGGTGTQREAVHSAIVLPAQRAAGYAGDLDPRAQHPRGWHIKASRAFVLIGSHDDAVDGQDDCWEECAIVDRWLNIFVVVFWFSTSYEIFFDWCLNREPLEQRKWWQRLSWCSQQCNFGYVNRWKGWWALTILLVLYGLVLLFSIVHDPPVDIMDYGYDSENMSVKVWRHLGTITNLTNRARILNMTFIKNPII